MIRTCLSPKAFSNTSETEPVFIEVKTPPTYGGPPSAGIVIERTSKSLINRQGASLRLETEEEAQILIEMLTAFLAERRPANRIGGETP